MLWAAMLANQGQFTQAVSPSGEDRAASDEGIGLA